MGAAALDLCSVAAGRVDVCLEVGLSPGTSPPGPSSPRRPAPGSPPSTADRWGQARSLAAHPALFDEVIGLLDELGAASV